MLSGQQVGLIRRFPSFKCCCTSSLLTPCTGRERRGRGGEREREWEGERERGRRDERRQYN